MDAATKQDVPEWTAVERKVFAGILAAVFLFQIMTLRQGHDWGGDFAQYLSHARNIADFQPYANTGYIYNPDSPVIGPRAYPPIFPLFLAPIYAIYGADFVVLKVAIALLFMGTLGLAASLFSTRLSPWGTIALTALLGFCTIFWEFNNALESEHLFIIWWLLAMWIHDRYRTGTEIPSESFVPAICLGLVIYLAIGTRTVGIVLPPALLLTEFLRFRRLTRFTVITLSTAIAFYALQKLLLPLGGSGYMDQVSRISAKTLAKNLYLDAGAFTFFWKNGYFNFLTVASGLIFGSLAIVGFVKENWPRVNLYAVAAIIFFILVVVWPGAYYARMIWPLLPGFLFWLIYALENMLPSRKTQLIAINSLVIYTFICYAGFYSQQDFSPIEGPGDPTAQELFAEVEQHVDANSICLFFKPRVLAFYTNRKTVGYPIDIDHESLTRTIDRDQVEVVITKKDQSQDIEPLLLLEDFQTAWSNSEFKLWRRASKD